MKDYHISQLEALNVVQAVKTLIPADLWDARVVVHTDNMAAMFALNTGRTKDHVLAACAREIWLVAALRGLDILLLHVPGVDLPLADALSRRAFNPTSNTLARTLVAKLNLTRAYPLHLNNLLLSCL